MINSSSIYFTKKLYFFSLLRINKSIKHLTQNKYTGSAQHKSFFKRIKIVE